MAAVSASFGCIDLLIHSAALLLWRRREKPRVRAPDALLIIGLCSAQRLVRVLDVFVFSFASTLDEQWSPGALRPLAAKLDQRLLPLFASWCPPPGAVTCQPLGGKGQLG